MIALSVASKIHSRQKDRGSITGRPPASLAPSLLMGAGVDESGRIPGPPPVAAPAVFADRRQRGKLLVRFGLIPVSVAHHNFVGLSDLTSNRSRRYEKYSRFDVRIRKTGNNQTKEQECR